MRLGVPSICNKGETMSKRPPANSTGKLALAGKRKQAHQILDCKILKFLSQYWLNTNNFNPMLFWLNSESNEYEFSKDI